MDMMNHKPSDDVEAGDNLAEDLAELERFVVENEERLQLEQRIGRFNIFDSLGIVRTEIRHSNFLDQYRPLGPR